jgi:tetratricopeptide (TPR) repeat protein
LLFQRGVGRRLHENAGKLVLFISCQVNYMKLLKQWKFLNSKAVAFYQQGWYSVAASLGEETLKFAEKAFGTDHPYVAESLNNLAIIYFSQAKEAEAAIFEQTLTQREGKVLWPDHPETSQYLNKHVLHNLAQRKYSQAESLFRRTLEIKKNALGREPSEWMQVLGNLADLHKSQGKYAEAESYLRSLRVRDKIDSRYEQLTDEETENSDLRELSHNREYMRCSGYFPARLSKSEKTGHISGITENISQVGTFIKTKDWKSFRTDDQVSIAISLPSVFSEQNATIDMEGRGIVTRVDEENEGVAIQFMRTFKQFKRVGEKELPGKIRYKKIAHYLKVLEDTSLTSFVETYPKGFFVERFQLDFDSDVIFQFSTKQIDILDELSGKVIDSDFLEARVIEINSKKIENNEGVITIGRSASNDIVLYNKTVSKSHAFLYFPSVHDDAYVADLKSTNSTFINDEKITPHVMYQLADGNEISFGPQTKLIFLTSKTFHDFLVSLKKSRQSQMDS